MPDRGLEEILKRLRQLAEEAEALAAEIEQLKKDSGIKRAPDPKAPKPGPSTRGDE